MWRNLTTKNQKKNWRKKNQIEEKQNNVWLKFHSNFDKLLFFRRLNRNKQNVLKCDSNANSKWEKKLQNWNLISIFFYLLNRMHLKDATDFLCVCVCFFFLNFSLFFFCNLVFKLDFIVQLFSFCSIIAPNRFVTRFLFFFFIFVLILRLNLKLVGILVFMFA